MPESRFWVGRVGEQRVASAALLSLAVFATSAGVAAAAPQLPASAGGQWSPVYDWEPQLACPSPDVHSDISAGALLPIGMHRGKVLFWRESCNSSTVQTYLFDPDVPGNLITITHPTLASDLFCAGFSWDSQGQLVVAGGNPNGTTNAKETYFFSPTALNLILSDVNTGARFVHGSQAWQRVDDMHDSRYYPSLCPLNRRAFGSAFEGGGHLVVGGSPNPHPVPAPTEPCHYQYHQYSNEPTVVWQQVASQTANPPPTVYWNQRVMYPAGSSAVPASPAIPVPFDRYDLLGNLVAPTAVDPTPNIETYPRMFQLSDLNLNFRQHIFVANDLPTFANLLQLPNPDGMAWTIRPPYGTQTDWRLQEAPRGFERFYGTAVMLHTLLDKNRILTFGGARNHGTPSDPNWQIVPEVQEFVIPGGQLSSQGTWITKSTGLNQARIHANAVILPTGEVLVVGGGSIVGSCDAGAGNPVFTPELYTIGLPGASGASTVVMNATNPVPGGSLQAPRLYHSMATLLADGRVLLAGGETYPPPLFAASGKNGEIFSPPYLFQGPRPTIGSAAAATSFSTESATSTFSMTVAHDGPLDRVVLLRPSAVTHAFDIDQRYIELEFTPGGSSTLTRHTVTAPREDLGPPGWYMLFVVHVVNGNRIPSNAWWIHIS